VDVPTPLTQGGIRPTRNAEELVSKAHKSLLQSAVSSGSFSLQEFCSELAKIPVDNGTVESETRDDQPNCEVSSTGKEA
jgi:hypothetical protein